MLPVKSTFATWLEIASSLRDAKAEFVTSREEIADEMAFSATDVKLQFSNNNRFNKDASGKALE